MKHIKFDIISGIENQFLEALKQITKHFKVGKIGEKRGKSKNPIGSHKTLE